MSHPPQAAGRATQTPSALVSLNVLKDLSGLPVETLDSPLSPETVQQQLVSRGFGTQPTIRNKSVKDGIYLSGNLAKNPALPALLSQIVLACHQVKDEHMPAMSVVQCGFIRALSLENSLTGDLNLTVYMRFTVDECPAGKRLTQKVLDAVQAIPQDKSPLKIGKTEVVHGGSKWKVTDSDEQVQKILSALFGQPRGAAALITPPAPRA